MPGSRGLSIQSVTSLLSWECVPQTQGVRVVSRVLSSCLVGGVGVVLNRPREACLCEMILCPKHQV
eukprot:3079946-Ditylum_brightwellii.AAC.1